MPMLPSFRVVWPVLPVVLVLLGVRPSMAAPRFSPPSGRTILFIGQDVDSIGDYVKDVGSDPAGFMSYTSLENMEGLSEAHDEGGGEQHAQALIDQHPAMAWQLGLYLVDQIEGTISGHYDDRIDKLGAFLQAAHRPVFLRIGYEFDLPANRYDPAKYILAYRHIVDRLRKNGVTNVAFVWHSYAQGNPERFDDWYPGDAYVDWVGASYFGQFPKFENQVADLAERHHRPFMLAETSSWNIHSEAARTAFFLRLFKFIRDRHVAALCYIDANWDAQDMWISQKWGDGRVQPYPDVFALWKKETSAAAFLKSSPDLFKTLGYKP